MKMNHYFQYVLFFLAFLTFGLGDTLSAVIMMGIRGSIIEYNILYAYIYETQGYRIFIIAKVLCVIAVLTTIFICQHLSKGKMYWKINGLLMALTIGGTMATIANVKATIGHIYLNPEYIIIIYVTITIIFISIGDYIDKHQHAVDSVIDEA